MPPTTLGTFFVVQSSRPGSTRSGENARWKSLPASRPLPVSSSGLHLLPCRARVRRRLEDDELPRAQPLRDLLRGRDEDLRSGSRWRESGVGSAIEDRVGVAELVVVRRRGDPPVVDERLERLGRDVLDVALAAVQRARPAPGRRRRAGRSCPHRRRRVRAAGRRSRLRRWRRPASSAGDRSEPAPARSARRRARLRTARGRSAGHRRRRRQPRRGVGVVVDEHVRAHLDRVDPLRGRAQGHARHAVPVRLFLQAAGVGHDHARLRGEGRELEVAERIGQTVPAELEPRSSIARVCADARGRRRARRSRLSPSTMRPEAGLETFAWRWTVATT